MTKVMLELQFLPYVLLKLLCTYMKRVSLTFFTLRGTQPLVRAMSDKISVYCYFDIKSFVILAASMLNSLHVATG